MASVSSPYGLIPVGLVGGQSFAGQVREFRMTTNSATAIYAGDVVKLASGQPSAATASPAIGTDHGLLGACTGVRYVMPGTLQPMWAQFLPANAITNSYTSVFIFVADDPDAIFKVQSSAIGSFGDARAAIGKNADITNFGGSTVTGNSTVQLAAGSNGAGFVTTATKPFRIVGVVPGTELDAYPEFYVKWNQGMHAYNDATGV